MISKLKSETLFSWLIFYYMYNNADFLDVSSWGQAQLSFTIYKILLSNKFDFKSTKKSHC